MKKFKILGLSLTEILDVIEAMPADEQPAVDYRINDKSLYAVEINNKYIAIPSKYQVGKKKRRKAFALRVIKSKSTKGGYTLSLTGPKSTKDLRNLVGL